MRSTFTTAVLRRTVGALTAATLVVAPLLTTDSGTGAVGPRAAQLRKVAAARRVVPMLKLTSRGQEVSWVQKQLRIPADGIFGPQTLAAVFAFQKKRGLAVDGIVGPKTIAALRTKPRPSTSKPSTSCIVAGKHSFRNDWGAPRSGGRRHKGNDVFAPYGAPVLAIADGVVQRAYEGGLGGKAIILRVGKVRYYYAHQSKNLVTTGQQVKVGQVIGHVGDSGNARGGPAHIHFERWEGPIGSPHAINPFETLTSVC